MAMKAVSALLTLVFARSVVVQFNDPDPLVWIAVYSLATAISVAAFFDRLPAAAAKGAAAVFAAGLLFRITALPHISAEVFSLTGMGSVEVEQVREAWGLLICLAWSLLLVARGRPSETS